VRHGACRRSGGQMVKVAAPMDVMPGLRKNRHPAGRAAHPEP
jgi:hypothetical protein